MNIISDKVYRNTYVYYIKRVVIRSIPVYIIALLLGIMVCVYYKGSYSSYYSSNASIKKQQSEYEDYQEGIGKPLKMGDYMLYIFKRIEPIDKNVPADKKIELPVTYLAIIIMCAFIVGINVGDKDDYVVLCFSKSRNVWLTGKLSGMYISGIVIIMELILVVAVISGGKTGFASCESAYLVRYDYNKMTGFFSVMAVILSMVMSVVMLITLQFMISVILGQIEGYISITALSVAAIFVDSCFIPGNGLMLIRYSYFLSGGYNVIFICVYAIIVTIISYVVSNIYMKQKDIL